MADLQPLDHRMLEVLREDGRISNVDLARKVGVSEKTVRQRIARLVDRSGLRFRAELESAPAGTQVVYLLTAMPGQRLVVADRLARLRPVSSVRLTTGTYDIVVEAAFDSDAVALEFYVHEIETGPGIARSVPVHVIKSVRATSAPETDAPFREFDAAAGALGSVDALLDLACDVAEEEFGTARVFAGLMATDGAADRTAPAPERHLRWRGLSSRYIDAIFRNLRAHTVVPTEASRGQHLFVADARTDPLFAAVADLVTAEGFRSFLSLPIRHGEVPLGALNLYYNTVVPFDAEQVARAQELADAVGNHVARVARDTR